MSKLTASRVWLIYDEKQGKNVTLHTDDAEVFECKRKDIQRFIKKYQQGKLTPEFLRSKGVRLKQIKLWTVVTFDEPHIPRKTVVITPRGKIRKTR